MGADGTGFKRERLKALITAKGLHWTGLIGLGFHEQQVKSWLYGKRSPRTVEDALRICRWLEVPLEYLFGFSTRFDGMDTARVASRASLEHFLTSRPDLAQHVGEILEQFCDSPEGPRTVNAWRTLYEGVVRPSMDLGHAEAGIIERMAGIEGIPPSTVLGPSQRVGRAKATLTQRPPTPKVFVSYAPEDDAHTAWVRSLARDLRDGGLDVDIDRSDVTLHTYAPAVTASLHHADYVLLVCTPGFAAKAETERSILTAELSVAGNDATKFVPLLRRGEPAESLPGYLRDRAYLDVRADDQYADSLAHLLRHMRDTHRPPAVETSERKGGNLERATTPAGPAGSDVLYCRRCGAFPGRKSPCLGAKSHDFVWGRGRLFCGRCGQAVGVPTTCDGHRTHDFRSY